MSHPPDWLPYHCLNCGAYRGHGESAFAPCPDECSHTFEHRNDGGGEYQCAVCGHAWMGLPPDEWDGSLLTRTEKPFQPPPQNHYGRDHLGYRRSEWGAFHADTSES